jgi:hypothetical protein
MGMKLLICAVSFGALVCVLIEWLNGLWLQEHEDAYYFAGLFALTVAILCALHAGFALGRRGWSALWALLTVGGVCTFCSGSLYEGLSSPGWAGSLRPEDPDIIQQSHIIMLAPIVVIALAAVLTALLLRPRELGPAKPVDPPAGAA